MSGFYAGGINWVMEAIAQGKVERLFIQNDKKNKRITALIEEAARHHIECEYVPYYQLDALLPDLKHQGVVARCTETQQAKSWREALHGRAAPLILILDSIQDPHNLGACLRSAAAADVDAVLIPNHDACDLTPVARKVSSGGSEIVPVFKVVNLKREIEQMKKMGIWIVSAAGESASSLYDCDLKRATAIILGSEGEGIRQGLLDSSDVRAAIPMHNQMESLNVSVACGIFLFEALRQRR